jgi:hypothetical protein
VEGSGAVSSADPGAEDEGAPRLKAIVGLMEIVAVEFAI